MKVAVTGAAGLIGSALRTLLEGQGHQVVPLVRRPPRPGEIRWDPSGGVSEPGSLEGLDAVVHLAGAGVAAHRWSPSSKQEIVSSRVEGTGTLVAALARLSGRPRC